MQFGKLKDACSFVAYARPGDILLFTVTHERFAVKTGISTHYMCCAAVQVAALPVESKVRIAVQDGPLTTLVLTQAKAAELPLHASQAASQSEALGSLFVAAFANPSTPSSNPFDGPM